MKITGKGGQRVSYDGRIIPLYDMFWCYIDFYTANSIVLII